MRVFREVSDPRELGSYRAKALTGQLGEMLKQGWRIADPADLEKLGFGLDDEGKPSRRSGDVARSELNHSAGLTIDEYFSRDLAQ